MKYVSIDGAAATINVEGRFNVCKIVEVKAQLDMANQNGCTKVIVNFDNTTFIDSSVTRELAKIRRKVGKENFSAKNATGVVLTALKVARLDEWLKNNE